MVYGDGEIVKNYLQRMALSAIKPDGNIHPVLGHFFSTPKTRSVAESPGMEENNILAKELGEGAMAGSGLSRVSPANNRAVSEVQHLQSPVAERSEEVNPISTKDQYQQQDSPSIRAFHHLENMDAPVRRGLLAPEESVPQGASSTMQKHERVENPVRLDPPYRPLVAAEFTNPESTGTLPTPLRGAALENQRGKPENVDPSRKPGYSIREPDEIQIHIGRIEVTAVQSTVPNAAPTPRRRSAASLDEYLRQRDGRMS